MKRTTAISWLTGVVIVIGVIAWVFAFFLPEGNHLSNLRQRTTSLYGRKGELQAQLTSLQRLAAWENSVAGKNMASMLKQEIPSGPNMAVFLTEISNLAHQQSVQVTSISPSPATSQPVGGAASSTSAPPYLTIPVSMSLSGTYPDIFAFIQDLYSLPRLLVINSMSLSSSTSGASVITSSGGKPTGAALMTASLTTDIFTTAQPPPLSVGVSPGA
ncbi:MAG: type 4a pilus biogenesis protein PilO [Actinomycetota bacterium]|jgi:Tfp pilus assembly protein PilO|nr:type 4a pilus biogenesis protein PilO [Actinomycetota bacterium]